MIIILCNIFVRTKYNGHEAAVPEKIHTRDNLYIREGKTDKNLVDKYYFIKLKKAFGFTLLFDIYEYIRPR